MFILSYLFFLTAILYSSVGFGGGSTYLALLLIWGIPYQIFPVIALCCNIIVVSGNCFNYARSGNINIKLLIPYLISSIPFAFIGGSLQLNKDFFEILIFIVLSLAGLSLLFKFKSFDDISETIKDIPKVVSLIIGGSISIDKNFFEILLFIILALAGIMLLLKFKSFDKKIESFNKIPKIVAILIGGTIGFISGVVGIGGGIFLSPILLLVRVDSAKNIATAASLFILINSISGLTGQFTKASLSTDNDPPMNASGTDDIKYGVSILRLIFPALI